MKVILIDNLNREYIEDNLLKDNLSESEARKMADDYNKSHGPCWDWFAKVVPADYRLSRGIADLV